MVTKILCMQFCDVSKRPSSFRVRSGLLPVLKIGFLSDKNHQDGKTFEVSLLHTAEDEIPNYMVTVECCQDQVCAVRADNPETCSVFGVALLLFAQYGPGGQFNTLNLGDGEKLKALPLARSPRPRSQSWPALRMADGNIDELVAESVGTASAKANYQRAIGVRRLLRLGETMENVEFLGNWKGSTSSAAASENYAEQCIDTLAAAGGHVEKPYFIARDVPVGEGLVRECMPEVVDDYRLLSEQLRDYKGRRQKLPEEFNHFGYSVGHLLTELLLPAFLQDVAHLFNKYPDIEGVWPFQAALFQSCEFMQLRQAVDEAVKTQEPPLPLRALLEDVWWASTHGSALPSRFAATWDSGRRAGGTEFSCGLLHSASAWHSDRHARGAELSGGLLHSSSAGNSESTATRPSGSIEKERIREVAGKSSQLRGSARREQALQAWNIAGNNLVGSEKNSNTEAFLTCAKEYFQGSSRVPAIRDLIYGNSEAGAF